MDVNNKKQQSGAGIAGMILGIFAILTSCILVGGVLGFIGIILSAVGTSQKDKSGGTAIAGIILNIIALVITVFVLFSSIDRDSNSKDSTNSNNVNAEHSAISPEKNDDPFSDDIIDVDISDCHIKYLKHEIVENMSGDKCVAVYYEFTNNSNKGKTFNNTISDKAFQNGVELKISSFHVNDESKDRSLEIKPGVTITVCSGFVLRDTETDVEIEVEEWINLKNNPEDKMLLSIIE